MKRKTKWKANKKFIIVVLLLGTLIVYFFVTAPHPLPEIRGGDKVSVETMFRILAAENASIRSLYTAEIVGPGIKQGLKFQEGWKNKETQAGPLPALFLREMSTILQRDAPQIGLFLGSDYPIVKANLFKGVQAEEFKKLRTSQKPQFFRDKSTGRYTAMFPDYASAKACVTCHNEHSKTPKSDWKLNDIMGATTWIYPKKEITVTELLKLVAVLRKAACETYEIYLKKVNGFDEDKKPVIGDKWPKDGMFLPSVDVFREAIEVRNSPETLKSLLQIQKKKDEKSNKEDSLQRK